MQLSFYTERNPLIRPLMSIHLRNGVGKSQQAAVKLQDDFFL